MRKFTYDYFHHISSPTIILCTRWHNNIGLIDNITNISNEFNMASHQEISFDVHKFSDGKQCSLWNQIVDFKYIYVKEQDEYYELEVDIDETDETIKHCVGVSAGERELSQKYLRDFHCNDEVDILSKDKNGQSTYTVTVLYNPEDPKGSLLDRVLSEKCSEWTVDHVDSTIAGIQRTFTVSESTVYDFFANTVANEIGCLFQFNSANRSISVYDLNNTCEDCGFRGDFVDTCPKCGGKHFIEGYGVRQNVFISPKNFATQISVNGDTDNVKNCFRVVGGDDLLTATVRNINPNQSNYIYRFSAETLADMPEELSDKINDYNELYQSKMAEYTSLTDDWYYAQDQKLYYKTSMAPETPIPQDTTALEQLHALMSQVFSVSVQKLETTSKSSADLAVQNYAKVLVDPRYTVTVSESTLGGISQGVRVWEGKFTVTSLGKVNPDGTQDSATSEVKKMVGINEDYEEFLEQKIQKSLDRSDASFTTIFNIEDDVEFKTALEDYSLDRLNSFSNTYQSVLEILIKQGVADTTKGSTDNQEYLYRQELYDDLYLPLFHRKKWIDEEAEVREITVNGWQENIDTTQSGREAIQRDLNFRDYIGDELWTVFNLYLREDTYSNSNYISTNLNNEQLIQKATELFEVAENELYKASELQYNLTGTLNNFLNTEEFKDFKNNFQIGDWIICEADDRLYKLRLINLGYDYDSPESLQVTFSNVSKTNTTMNDVQSILRQSSSMATTYNYVAHQAEQGNEAQTIINTFVQEGLDSARYNILSGENQEITIDDHGLTGREYIDVLEDYSPEQVKLTNNLLAFTKDNWETASLALGKHTYTKYDKNAQTFKSDEDYGLSSTFVQSGYIYGSQIVSGDIYSENYSEIEKTGTHIDLNTGKFNFGGDGLTFDGTHLYLGGFEVVPGGFKTDAIYIGTDGTIESESIVGKIDSTETSDTHGEIFNAYTDGCEPHTPYDELSMSSFISYREDTARTSVKKVSNRQTIISWDGTSDDIGCIYYYNHPIHAKEGLEYITVRIDTGTRNRESSEAGSFYNMRVGLSQHPPERVSTPTGKFQNFEQGMVEIREPNKTYYVNIPLPGNYDPTYNHYLVIDAPGWNATVRDLRYASHISIKNKAIGIHSHAEGNGVTASGNQSHAEGWQTTSAGEQSHAEGKSSMSVGLQSHAEGLQTVATGDQSHAEGNHTTAVNTGAHAEGIETLASGLGTHAEGTGTRSVSQHAHAEGFYTLAAGSNSHAEGQGVQGSSNYGAFGTASHSEGNCTKSAGDYSHAEGYYTTVTSVGGHVEGYHNTCSGYYAHAEGYYTVSSEESSHSEGHNTEASGAYSHAEGFYTQATNYESHAEGDHTEATGGGSHAEGGYTHAIGSRSHAEGSSTYARGFYSHAEGANTQANGEHSHVEGLATIASRRSQHVFGEHNIEDTYTPVGTGSVDPVHDRGKYVEIVGNGTSDVQSNAYTLDWDGNGWYAGKVTVGVAPTNNMDVATKKYVDDNLADFVGATSQSAGTHGFVPAPTILDENKFLKGDGTWSSLNEYVAITQAEYDALSQAEKQNGQLYFITDADSIPYMELTQTQYDALTYAEKHNGTLYFITDAS